MPGKLRNSNQLQTWPCASFFSWYPLWPTKGFTRDHLHWLPHVAWIKFKVCPQTWKCLKSTAPDYLWKTLSLDNNKCTRIQGSSSDSILEMPWTHVRCSEHSLPSAIPSLSGIPLWMICHGKPLLQTSERNQRHSSSPNITFDLTCSVLLWFFLVITPYK